MRFRAATLGSTAWLLAAQSANGASLCIAPGERGGQPGLRAGHHSPDGLDGFCPDTDAYVPGENDFEVAWSISASNLDPYQTTAAIGGAQTLYLWFVKAGYVGRSRP